MVGCFRFVKLPLDYFISLIWPGYFITPSSCWDARTLCRPSNGPVHQIHLLMKRGPRRSLKGSLTITTDPLQVLAHQQETGHEAVGQTLQKIHGDRAGGVPVRGSSESNQGEKDETGTVNRFRSISINIIQSCFCLSSILSSINAIAAKDVPPTLVTPCRSSQRAPAWCKAVFPGARGDGPQQSKTIPGLPDVRISARCSEWTGIWT